MSESARDPYVGINQHISQRANKEQHPTYTIGRILSLDPIKIRADGIDLTGCTTKASILQKIREYEADAAAAAAIISPEG